MIDQSPTLRSIFNVSELDAKERILTAVDESIWDGIRMPRRLRDGAAAKIAATLDAFLSTSVTTLVNRALQGYRELAMYADDRSHRVDNFELSIESDHEPQVDLRVKGLPSQTLKFPLTVAIQFQGATLIISRNRVMSMKPGRCIAAGTLRCEKAEVFNRPASPFKIRTELQFGDGIPIHRVRS